MKKYTHKAMIDRLIRECDRLWRLQILLRAKGHCQICGAPRPADKGKWVIIAACHIISRRFWSTRWDRRNGLAGCSDCHDEKTIMAWLKDTDRKRYNWVMKQRRMQVSHRDIDLEKILKKLRSAA